MSIKKNPVIITALAVLFTIATIVPAVADTSYQDQYNAIKARMAATQAKGKASTSDCVKKLLAQMDAGNMPDASSCKADPCDTATMAIVNRVSELSAALPNGSSTSPESGSFTPTSFNQLPGWMRANATVDGVPLKDAIGKWELSQSGQASGC